MHGFSGGACVVDRGGVLLLWGACMVALGGAWLLWGDAWLLRGTCMVAPGGMHGCSGGHAWLLWGEGHAWLLLGGMHGCSGGHVWLLLGGGHAWDTMRYGDTINERAVLILLECILVIVKIHFALPFASRVLLTYVKYGSGAASCQNLGSGAYKLPATVLLIIISWCLCQLDAL